MFLFAAGDAHAGKVLVIESYHAGYGWDAGYLRGLSGVLEPENEIRTFELDTKRIPLEQFTEKAQQALAVFREYQPDLVILGDDNATRLLAPELLPTGVALVYLGVNSNPREYGLYGHDQVVGIMERPLLVQSVHVAEKILPKNLRRVLFLFDTSETSDLVVNDVFHDRRQLMLGSIQADALQRVSFADWMDAVRNAKANGYDMVILGLYQRLKDKHGNCADGDAVLDWTMKHINLPVMGLWEFSIGPGKAAAGLAHSGEFQGRAAGELAQKLLRGERSVEIPTKVEEGMFFYSRSEATRQGFVIPDGLRGEGIELQ